MKKWFLILSAVISFQAAQSFAQAPNAAPTPDMTDVQKNITGGKFYQDELPSKPFVIFYIKPTCGGCQQELGRLSKLVDRLGDTPLFIVGTNSGGATRGDLSWFVENFVDASHRPQFKVLYDSKGKLKESIGLVSYPTIAVFNSSKQMVKKFEEMNTSIDDILSALI